MGVREDKLLQAIELVAPGTPLRVALDDIISASTGALIVLDDGEEILAMSNGGFRLDCEFTPHKLFELAKMDGAIILSKDLRKVLLVNVHLVPDPSLPTSETGMRHRTAERVARQTGALVISVSQKRAVVTLYKGDIRYILEDLGTLLAKANQALQTLEKYRSRLDRVSSTLSALEFQDLVTLGDVVMVAQRAEMVERIAGEIRRYIAELGINGRLIRMQLEELMGNVEDDHTMLLRDYMPGNMRPPDRIKQRLSQLSSEELLDTSLVAAALGHDHQGGLDIKLSPRGYRMLSKVPRLPWAVITNVVRNFGSFQQLIEASPQSLDEVEGVGTSRAKAIKEGLDRLRQYSILER